MDVIYNIFSDISPRQSVIAIDILRVLFNKRKQGMDLVELNCYFRNRYIHYVRNTIRWLKDMGYITQLENKGVGARYFITLAGVQKYWEIQGKIGRNLYEYIV